MTANNRLVQQAKSGNPDAITRLLNQQLSAKGIHAEVTPTAGGLAIALYRASQAPPLPATVTYLTSAFRRLAAPGIATLEVSGWQTGAKQATWQQVLTLAEDATAQLPKNVASITVNPQPPKSASTPQRSREIATTTTSSRRTFNGSLFRLGWLLVTVPFVWLAFWMPQILFRLDATGDNRFQYLYENQQWQLFIPLAIGQWLLLQKHLRGAYWWAVVTILVFYFEAYPRAMVGSWLLKRLYVLVGGPSGTSGTILLWLSNGVLGLVAGALLGVFQWQILRRSLHPPSRTAHWIWISAIAWGIGFGLPINVVRFGPNLAAVFPRTLWPLASVIELLATGMGPLLLAIITGGVLAHWLHPAKVPSHLPSSSAQ